MPLDIKKQLGHLNTIATIIGAITVIATGYIFFMSNIWKPTVVVVKADYINGVATIRMGEKDYTLFQNETLWAGGTWGVRFNGNSPTDKPNRIELIKNQLVYDIIDLAPAPTVAAK